MGWWAVSENSEILVGDEVLDSAKNFFVSFSKSYKKDLNRNPTLAELEHVLSLTLKYGIDDEILSDFEEVEIKQISIKTAKRAKRQNPKPGDIFAFKINDGRFCFGRIVSKLPSGTAIEVFDYFSKSPIFDYSKINDWLILPITIGADRVFKNEPEGDWRIIGETENYTIDKKMKEVYFIYGIYPDNLTAVNAFGDKKSISAENAKKFTLYSPRGDFDVKQIIENHLSTNT